jgi:hypothetical protein
MTGCSDDKSEAVEAVCGAADEVTTALAELAAFDPSTESSDDVENEREALADAVSDLGDAAADLNQEQVDSVQAAYDDLEAQLDDLSGDPVAEAAPDAVASYQAAVSELESTWEQAIADADC